MTGKKDKPTRRSVIDPAVADLLAGDRRVQRQPQDDVQPSPSSPRKSRKKRKDATGQKSDYHKDTSMIGARLSDEIIEEVRARAAREGLSVNAWLGRLIRAELERGG